MAPIPFPLGSSPGRRTHESAGRLINAYAEPLGPGAVAEAKIVSSAGLLKFTEAVAQVSPGPPPVTTPLTGYRGGILVGSTLYAAFSGILVTINSTGKINKAADLSGTDRVQFSRNNRQPHPPPPPDPPDTDPTPDVVATTQLSSYLCSPTTAVAFEVPDMDERTNTFMDGYTLYGAPNGRIQASGINRAGVFNALDFTTVQAKAGTLRRLIAYDQHLFAFCDTWIEVYRNVGNPSGFPFNRIAVINRGLIAPYAVAGYQPGFGKALVWVGDDYGVHILNGYEATRISTPDIDRAIEMLADKSSIEMQCYVTSGAAFVTVSSSAWTWEFNLTTQQWNERRSNLANGLQLQRWRATGETIEAFGRWLCGDTHGGSLHQITTETRRENDAPLIMRVESAPVHDFPRGFSVPRADFNFAPGTGIAPGLDPIQTNPRVQIAWSDDGGLHWGNPLLRPFGRQDENPEVTVLRTGRTQSQGRRWALSISDPVYVALLGGDMSAEPQV